MRRASGGVIWWGLGGGDDDSGVYFGANKAARSGLKIEQRSIFIGVKLRAGQAVNSREKEALLVDARVVSE